MPPKARNGGKRQISTESNFSDTEGPPKKKQDTSDRSAGSGSVKKAGLKQEQQPAIIDLESQEPRFVPRKLVAERGEFPRFTYKGEVYIELVELSPNFTYVFPQSTIQSWSTVLAECLRQPCVEADSTLAKTVKKIDRHPSLKSFMHLEFTPEINMFTLVQGPFTFFKAPETLEPQKSKVAQAPTPSKQRKASGLQAPLTPESPRPVEEAQSFKDSSVVILDSELHTPQEAPIKNPTIETAEPEASKVTNGVLEPADQSPNIEVGTAVSAESQTNKNETSSEVDVDQAKLKVVEIDTTIKEEGEKPVISNSTADVLRTGPAVNEEGEDIMLAAITADGSMQVTVLGGDTKVIANSAVDLLESKSAGKEAGEDGRTANIAESIIEQDLATKPKDDDTIMEDSTAHTMEPAIEEIGKEAGRNGRTASITESIIEQDFAIKPKDDDTIMEDSTAHAMELTIEGAIKRELEDSARINNLEDSTETEPVVKDQVNSTQAATESAIKSQNEDIAVLDTPLAVQALGDSDLNMLESSLDVNGEIETKGFALQQPGPPSVSKDESSTSAAKGVSCNGIKPASDYEAEAGLKEAVSRAIDPTANPHTGLEVDKTITQESAPAIVNLVQTPIRDTTGTIADPEIDLDVIEIVTHESIVTDINILTPKSFRYAHGEISAELPAPSTTCHQKSKNLKTLRTRSVRAHHNLFRIWYGFPPQLDKKDANNAFGQIEDIVTIAKFYDCPHDTSAPLMYHVHHFFTQELFQAIAENPPRWLLLSIALQNGPIFKAAIVHLVGQYPHYPWTEYPSSKIPPQILVLIRKKVNKLDNLKASINADLFFSAICIDHQSLSFPGNFKAPGFRTWFLVQIWQDWLRNNLSPYHTATCDVGTVYRLIAKGGSAYLDHGSVYEILTRGDSVDNNGWTLKELKQDLQIMKKYAQKRVEALVLNSTIIDVEENGIHHLTCTKIENEELPWDKEDEA